MRTLTMAFFGEGSTDHRFLPIVVQRTAIDILCRFGGTDVEVLEPISVGRDIQEETQAERIVRAAESASGMDLLIVHLDADTRDLRVALEERFLPGLEAVQRHEGMLCKTLLPIVPVKNLEAWLLCDIEAFQQTVGTNLSHEDLGLPFHAHEVEALVDPKGTYRGAVRAALTARRRRGRVDPGEYYEPLGRSIRLERLQRVPAFQSFWNDLARVLRELHFV